MKLASIIEQIQFSKYAAMVRVIYSEDADIRKLDDLIRALPGVSTVSNAGNSAETLSVTYKVGLISQKTGEEAFEAFKSNAIQKYSVITDIQLDVNSIEEK